MTKREETKLIKQYAEFLKLSPMKFDESSIKGYRTISETEMSKKDAEFLKYIGYDGDRYDFDWEYKTNLVKIRLRAMEM